jgi:uncharacterized membrane protein HdeD (DUF308 family)
MAPAYSGRLGHVGQADRALTPEELARRAHRFFLVTGILAILAGAVSIVVPIVTSVAMTLFVGWILVFNGVVMGFHAVSRRHAAPRSAMRVVTAALSLLVGLYLVILPLSGTITLTFLLAVWFFGSGVALLAGARWERGVPGAWMPAVHGLVSIVLGVLIAVSLPSSAAWAIGLLVGINLVFWGLHALGMAGLISRATRSP